MCDLFGRDSSTRVAHLDVERTAHGVGAQVDLPSTGGELERIGEEISEHLVHAIAVPQHVGREMFAAPDDESDAALQREHLECLLELIEERPEGEPSGLEFATAGLEPTHVQQLLHQSSERLDLRVQCPKNGPLLLAE